MNIALLRAEIEAHPERWHGDYNQIAAALNAPDPQYTLDGQDIDPVELQLTLAARGLLTTLKAAITSGKTPGAKEYAQAAVNITQMVSLQANDLRKENADALISGLVAGEVITKEDETALRVLQTKPMSFARSTWGEDVTSMDVVKAFPKRW